MTTERSDYESWKAYPDQEEYDLNYHKEILLLATGKVLDIGCGKGILTKKIAEKEEVTHVTAMDKFDVYQREKHPKIWQWQVEITEGIGFKDEEPYDTIVSTEFIEHITKEQLLQLLYWISKRLKEDGKFIGTTPIKVQETTNKFHLQEYTIAELKEVLEQFFTKVEIKDIGNYCQLWIAQS